MARLFVAKQELRQFQQASADAKQAAQEAAGTYSPESYLAAAADLDMLAEEMRGEIAELEAERDRLRVSAGTMR